MSATASPPRPLAPSSTPTVQGLTNRDPIMGRDKKAVAGPSLVALRTSFGTSSLDASTSTLFGSSTGRKRGRAQVSSSPEPSSSREPASSPPPPPKKGSADDPDYASLYPVCGPGFYNSWPKQAPEGKRPKGEKRLRRFRTHPPQSFLDVYHRAVTQRFYVLSRTGRGGIDFWFCPEEELDITGSTGNVYDATIAEQPTCTCPHAQEGKQCKYVIFVLARVLRAKPQYVYQLALLPEELCNIFDYAPPSAAATAARAELGFETEMNKKRKPVEGDCPICFEEMTMDSRSEPLSWCKAACGQNIHSRCLAKWAHSQRGGNDGDKSDVTCPYCRSKWEGDVGQVELATVKQYGTMTGEGYVNVADQLGISRVQDTSTYSRYWSGHPRSYRRWTRWQGGAHTCAKRARKNQNV